VVEGDIGSLEALCAELRRDLLTHVGLDPDAEDGSIDAYTVHAATIATSDDSELGQEDLPRPNPIWPGPYYRTGWKLFLDKWPNTLVMVPLDGNANNEGLDGGTLGNVPTFGTADTERYPAAGCLSLTTMPSTMTIQLYTFTDAGCLLYVPSSIPRNTTYGILSRGNTTHCQTAWFRVTTEGVLQVNMHHTRSAVRYAEITVERTELDRWYALGFEFQEKENLGGTAICRLWIDGELAGQASRGQSLSYQNALARYCGSGGTTPTGWGVNTAFSGSGAILAAGYADNAGRTNTAGSIVGNGSQMHLDYAAAMKRLFEAPLVESPPLPNQAYVMVAGWPVDASGEPPESFRQLVEDRIEELGGDLGALQVAYV
jgi:hypothetical protein